MRGKFTYKIMQNEETGYCVCRYHFPELNQDITCIGYNLPMNKVTYDFEYEEVQHPKYGRQFKIMSFTESIGKDRNELIEYMTLTYDGIGKKTAERIYSKFGPSCIDIIEQNPAKLLAISRVSRNVLDKIVASVKKKNQYKDLYMLLLKYDFSNKLIERIIRVYHERAFEQIKGNPYILCDIKGIDFCKADLLREECGIGLTDDIRLYAAVIQSLKDDTLNGNSGTTKETLLNTMYRYLSPPWSLRETRKTMWRTVLKMIRYEQISYRKVFFQDNVVQYMYLKFMCEAENKFASDIVSILQKPCEPIPNLEQLIKTQENAFGIRLDESQKDAVRACFTNNFLLITGGPGMGKTTIVNIICAIYEQVYVYGKNNKNEPELLAPTGRAARRLSELSGRGASTIHSRLHLGIQDQENTSVEDEVEPIRDTLLIVDEFSMVDLLLGCKLLSQVENSKVVFVGDENQLPSVNAGQLLYDLVTCGCVPVARLKTTHRQEQGSSICINANGMQDGVYDLIEDQDFRISCADEPGLTDMERLQTIEDAMIKEYLSCRDSSELENVVCLCPYKKYPAGVYSVNKRIQDIVNPLNGGMEMKGTHEMVFRVGDHVMHLKNEDDTMNGDLGIVKRIYKDSDNGMVMEVAYDTYLGMVNMFYTSANIEDVTLAYAMTVHKSQGSEYDAVITCITGFHKPMLYLNILYTAITRGKKRVYLHTDSKETIKTVVLNKDMKRRNSLVAHNIRSLCEEKYTQMRLAL